MKKTFRTNSPTLTFNFENEKAAEHFKSWLCGQGEQDYWMWMEYREQEESGDITGIDFDYHSGSVIKATCGRLDKG